MFSQNIYNTMGKLKEIITSAQAILEIDNIFAKIVIAIIALFIAWNFINFSISLMNKTLSKRNFDETLQPFLLNVFLWIFRGVTFIAIASYLGIETTSLIALLGAIGFAIGMALQGALGNLAGGVLILLNRPYKVGDLVEMQDHIGNVKEIQVFNTILLSPENKTVIMPNGAVSNGNIVNYTIEGLIRVDLSIGVSYNADIKKSKEILLKVMNENPDVLETPPAFVGVSELADSSVNLVVRPYTTPEKYWDVYFNIYESAKEALDNASIEIPYPQVDIHLNK